MTNKNRMKSFLLLPLLFFHLVGCVQPSSEVQKKEKMRKLLNVIKSNDTNQLFKLIDTSHWVYINSTSVKEWFMGKVEKLHKVLEKTDLKFSDDKFVFIDDDVNIAVGGSSYKIQFDLENDKIKHIDIIIYFFKSDAHLISDFNVKYIRRQIEEFDHSPH